MECDERRDDGSHHTLEYGPVECTIDCSVCIFYIIIVNP